MIRLFLKGPIFFYRFSKAKNTLTDPNQRARYDKWQDSGLCISFRQWQGLKDAVHTSMHWATPKLAGRMLGVPNPMDDGEPLSLRASPAPTPPEDDEDDLEEELKDVFKEESSSEPAKPQPKAVEEAGAEPEYSFVDPEDTEYEATPYEGLRFRVETPPGEWGWSKSEEKEIKAEELSREISSDSTSATGGARPKVDSATVKKRQAFAQRRDSSIGAMMMVDQMDDREIRRRFRNYEI